MTKETIKTIGIVILGLAVLIMGLGLTFDSMAEYESQSWQNTTQWAYSGCINNTIASITQAVIQNNGTIQLPLIVDVNGTVRQGIFRFEGLA